MGVGALSVCGVTDLGPQTADPDAGSSSRSGGAAMMCGLGGPGWRLCHLRRPCRGASDVGVTSPPPSPGSSPSHLTGLSSPGRALISVARFPEGRAAGGGFALPLSRDSLSYICCRVGITMVIPGLSRAPDTRELELGAHLRMLGRIPLQLTEFPGSLSWPSAGFGREDGCMMGPAGGSQPGCAGVFSILLKKGGCSRTCLGAALLQRLSSQRGRR